MLLKNEVALEQTPLPPLHPLTPLTPPYTPLHHRKSPYIPLHPLTSLYQVAVLGEGGVLPLRASSSVAVLGAFAERPRYQARP